MPLASKHVFKQRDATTNTEAATPNGAFRLPWHIVDSTLIPWKQLSYVICESSGST